VSLIALALQGCGTDRGKIQVPPGAKHAQCVNPASGAHWVLSIDEARRIVDGWPARIDPRTLAWRNRIDGGRYELDRASGVLSVTRASSTGGYITFDHCSADP
jgi:hypothetical protein